MSGLFNKLGMGASFFKLGGDFFSFTQVLGATSVIKSVTSG
jgi:hypothetical protein